MTEKKTESMLSPYRVLDLTDEKGFMCGKVLGDLGADVIKIEKPGGDAARRFGPFYHDEPDPEKSLYWFAYNMNKKGITLDIEKADGRDIFKKLVEKADFVIESYRPGYMDELGLGYEALSKINPRVIMTSITPYGQSGPYKDFKGSDIELMALSGMMYSTGEPDRSPTRISFPQAYIAGGVEAAVGSLTALYHRLATGEGQQVDVSIQDTMVTNTNNLHIYWEMNKVTVPRGGPGHVRPLTPNIRQRMIRACKDGYVTFSLMGGQTGSATTRKLISWMDQFGMAPEFAKETDWDAFDWANLGPHGEEMVAKMYDAIDRFFVTRTKQEILEEGVRQRIFMYPVCTPEDMMANQQLQAREFWQEVEHPELGETITYPGPFYKGSEAPGRVWRRAPLIGEHNEDIYEKELGFSRKELVTLKQIGVI